MAVICLLSLYKFIRIILINIFDIIKIENNKTYLQRKQTKMVESTPAVDQKAKTEDSLTPEKIKEEASINKEG